MSALHAVDLRVDALDTPLGIDNPRPEFSWRLAGEGTGLVQAAWQVQVTDHDDFDGPLLWDSGRVDGDLPFGSRYSGEALASRSVCRWRVRVWEAGGESAGWSEPAGFEMGMLDPVEWRASWISGPDRAPFDTAPLYLRRLIELPSPVVRGRAYVSALGWYRLFVNGTDLTGPSLVPRYTPFGSIVEYQVYDVTESFRSGSNVVAMAVGDGRFRGHIGFFDRRRVYGDDLAGFAQIELDLVDGSTVRLTTDSSWDAGTGRITVSDPKFGEHVDLRIPDQDWLTSVSAPARFGPVRVLPPHPRRLVAEEVARVTEFDRLTPQVRSSPSGKQLVDLGQNLAGVLRIRLRGPAGTRVSMSFGEVLTPEGEFDPDWLLTNPKKPWRQRDEVILDGHDQWWQPWFTIHGFRYVEVDGLPEDLDVEDVEGIALSTAVTSAGDFAASDARLTQLWRNVVWSTRSNFTDVPTDCPTRERSGWTGDIQVFTPTATGIVDAQAFLRRYLRSVAIEQKPNGNVPPWVPSERSGETGPVPRIIGDVLGNSVGWGDVTVLTPWELYRYYGDRAVLERQYESMVRWVERLRRAARRPSLQRLRGHRIGRLERYVLATGFHWGEWLRPGETFPVNLLDGVLHGASLATAYFEHSSRTLAQVAAVLGRDGDARRYTLLADRVRAAWNAAFVSDGGARIDRDLQDDYVRGIAFGLLDDAERERAASRLVELIDEAGGHLSTGFLSTPMLLDALVSTGHADVAFELLLQTNPPSWLHQIERGATTIWETWNGYDDDGRARDSHNHYAFGSVAGWLRQSLLGITPVSPGYRRIRIAPLIGGGIEWAEGTLETPFGRLGTKWSISPAGGRLEVTLPAGTESEIALPNGVTELRGSGQWRFEWRNDVQ